MGVLLALLPALIVGGVPSDDATVVAIRVRAACGVPAAVVCSGSLLSPRAVLTAAHCIDAAPLGLLEVVVAGDATLAGVAAVRIADALIVDGADLAVLVLTEPLPGATAALGALPADPVGATVVIVGYGDDGAGAVGIRRSGTASLDAVEPDAIVLVPGPALTCGGDSGGPVRFDDAVIGVTSYGDGACTQTTTAVRLDVHAEFIDDAIMQATMRPEGQPGPGVADCGDDSGGCRAGAGASRLGAALVLLALLGACKSSSKPAGACGDGTQHGAPPPKDTMMWCTDAGGARHGAMREWWPDGKPKLDAVYDHGKQHGPFTRWYEGGVKQEEGAMAGGLRVGTWTEFYEDGKPKRSSVYGADATVTWTLYREDDGTRWVDGGFRDQREHGKFVEYYPDGKRLAEGQFVDGKKADGWSYWTPDGQVSQVELGAYAAGAFGAE